jgi:hypothetical protein
MSMQVKPFFCIIFLAFGGCASITRGTTSDVEFISEPAGARVETSRLESCTTPCTLKVSRKDEFQATFKLEGYKDKVVFVRTQIAGSGAAGLVGNAVIGGPIGIGVDVITGATLEHIPNPVMVTLEKNQPTPAQPEKKRGNNTVPKQKAPAPQKEAESPAAEG